jgi:hypothetical protein
LSAFARSFLISRVTLFSLLLALLLGMGIWMSTQRPRDACAAYVAGDKGAQSTEYVVTGTRTVVVSCNSWLQRQPTWVQMLCLLELAVVGVFVLNGLGNVRDWFEMRRRLKMGAR